MKKIDKKYLFIIYLFLFLFFIPRPALAYIGPGSITLILQIVAGFMVGGLAVVAMSWSKIKAKLFRNKSS